MANPDRHADGSRVVRIRGDDLELLEAVRERLDIRQAKGDLRLNDRIIDRDQITWSDAVAEACKAYLRRR